MSSKQQNHVDLSGIKILVRGGGDLASGIAWRLHHCGFPILITEVAMPMAVRRKVSFCEAVYEGATVVDGVKALLARNIEEAEAMCQKRVIPVMIDPLCDVKEAFRPTVLVDAILAKKNTGTTVDHAPLVIGIGPGFVAGKDVHFVVETMRGHNLGRLITQGGAAPDTGQPGPVMGISADRVLRAPRDGIFEAEKNIGDFVEKGDVIGHVSGTPVRALINGVIRGLIHSGITVTNGLKIGDVDPRAIKEYCYTISDKALAIAGGVLEGILRVFANV